MALKVAWSNEALEDIEAIAAFIARDSMFYARATVLKLIDFSRSIGSFPRMGRVLPEINDPTIRECLVYSYRLVYKIERMRVLVVAIIHDKRSFNSVTERFS